MLSFFSPSKNIFLNPLWRDSYVAAGTWPEDAVEVTDAVFAEFGIGQSPEGKMRGVENGRPVWVDAPPPADSELAVGIRMQRDALLRDSDWTQAADVPEATAKPWREYRNLLRDVPQQPGFPQSVTWPDRP